MNAVNGKSNLEAGLKTQTQSLLFLCVDAVYLCVDGELDLVSLTQSV